MNYKEFLEQLNSRAGSVPSSEEKFKAKVAELTKNFEGTLDELNVKVQQLVESHNRMPRHEFAGLSSVEMSELLYYPFEDGSPIRLRTQIPHNALDKVGFFRLVEELLKLIKRDGHIKLTAKLGALPRRTLVELYDHHFIPDWPLDNGVFALRVEDDSTVMGTLHAIVRISGLVRKTHGKLVLTKLGEKMLSQTSRDQLFRIVLSTFTRQFDWAYNDGYPDFPLCRDACGFSVYLIAKLGGNETHKDFYAKRFLTAFPQAIEDFQGDPWRTPEGNFKSCYRIRTFDRFLEWFNLVNVRPNEETDEKRQQSLVRKNGIMDDIFVLA